MSQFVISVDPGSTVGWAVFADRRLALCGAWPLERFLTTWCISPRGATVVIERPVIYPKKKQKGQRDNDQVELALRAGEIRGRFREAGAACLKYVKPRTWKGTVPKDVTMRRVLSVLDTEETKLIYSTMSARAKKPNHNMIDGVGIGLWELERNYLGEAAHVRSP